MDHSDLVQALTANDTEHCRALLTSLADPDSRDGEGNTPLMLVARKGHLELVRLLLDRGADIDARNAYGGTPLLFALSERRREVVAFLLQHKAEVNLRGAVGKSIALMTPLGVAVLEARHHAEHLPLVNLLLAAGADANRADAEGRVPLVLAGSDFGLIDLLLAAKANINAPDKQGRTLLYQMARDPFTRPEALQELLARGADVEAADNEGTTPLHQAIQSGNSLARKSFANAQVLIDGRAAINRLGYRGNTVLHTALEENWGPEALAFILSCKPNINVRNSAGKTAFMLFVLNNMQGYAERHLSLGADINAQDSQGDTALHAALKQGGTALETVRFLVEHGADVNARNHRGETPLLLAATRGSDSHLILRYILEKGGHIHDRDRQGRSALYSAVDHQHLEAVRSLLEAGADYDAKMTNGVTPYQRALETHGEAAADEYSGDDEFRRDAMEQKLAVAAKILGLFHGAGAGHGR